MIKLGSTTINKAYLGSTNINKLYLGSTLIFDNSTINPVTGLSLTEGTFTSDIPVLSSFYVDATNTDRVYFSSTGTIDGMSSTGFIISNKTISSLTVNTGQLTGHYFTVSSAFTWWDNNTIRLEGGDGTVHDFTLEYITNNIAEPTATTSTIYVDVAATGSNNGTSEANAYTSIETALSSVSSSGTTVYVKAGTYNLSGWMNMPSTGTSTAPIKIIGYKTTPGDISSNYYTYTYGSAAPALQASEMPYFYVGTIGLNSTNHGGLNGGTGDDYIIIKNIQMGYGNTLVRFYSSANIVIENSNFKESGDGGGDGSAFEMYSSTSGLNRNQSNYRIKDCYIINAGMANMDIKGKGNLIDNVNTYCDNTTGTYDADGVSDYYINIVGSDNIVRNSFAKRRDGVATAALGHGIGVKAGEGSTFYYSYYNLFQNNYVINCGEGLYTRNTYADYNVFKDCEIDGLGQTFSTSYGRNGNGIAIETDSKYNIFERIYIHDIKRAITYENNAAEVPANTINEYNTVRNCIISDCYWLFGYGSSSSSNSPILRYNKVYNNTIDNIIDFYYQDGTFTTITGNEAKNNSLSNVSLIETLSGWTWSYNNFYNCNTTLGTNTYNLNPSFVSTSDFTPQNASLLVAPTLSAVLYDYEGTLRNATTTTLGAVVLASEVGSGGPGGGGGTEIFAQDNAASITSEVNAVGSWLEYFDTTITITSDATEHTDGSYSIKMEAIAADSGVRGEYQFSITSGNTYDISIWAKRGSGTGQGFTEWVGFTEFSGTDSQAITSTTWTEYTWTLTANITGTGIIRVYPNTGTTTIGDSLYVDKVSIVESA